MTLPAVAPPLAAAAELREMDRLASAEFGVPGLDLMEAAGAGSARLLLERGLPPGPVVVLAGAGNNGGDGFVVARHLAEAAYDVELLLLADPAGLRGDARAAFERLPAGVSVLDARQDAALVRLACAGTIVDALFGTGLSRPLDGLAARLVEAANANPRAWRVALDLPSGVHADTGRLLGLAFRAHLTTTYGLDKLALHQYPGAEAAGDVEVVDIGLPSEVISRVGVRAARLTEARARAALPLRPVDSHKGSFGHLLLLGGSRGKSGALLLAAHAALRSGVGLLTCLSDEATRQALAVAHPEAMHTTWSGMGVEEALSTAFTAAQGKTALALGPGWGLGDEQAAVLSSLALACPHLPLLLDADALTLAARLGPEFLRERARLGGATVLTPHPGEAARLLGASGAEVQADRPASARRLAETAAAYVVLKGARTLIARPDGFLYVVPFGSSALAHGGTGDVLAGLLGGLLATGTEIEEALLAGTAAHALAGELAGRSHGERGACAADVARALGEVWRAWEAGRDARP